MQICDIIFFFIFPLFTISSICFTIEIGFVYKEEAMTSFALKIIALVSMFCDHFGDAFVGHYSFLNLIGRIAFPIFAFQISEGFIHTKNLKKYFLRLGIFALIAQIPFSLFIHKFLGGSYFSLNVFFTLLFGLFSIWIYDYLTNSVKKNEKWKDNTVIKNTVIALSILIMLGIAYLAEVLDTDYGAWGVIVVFVFYLFKQDKLAMVISFITLCVIRYGTRLLAGFNMATLLLGIFTALSIVFICLYNGKQGKKIKYLLYVFYPVHLLLLYFIF